MSVQQISVFVESCSENSLSKTSAPSMALTSFGDGSHSCGSVPAEQRFVTSTCCPPIFWAKSAIG